MTTLKSCSIDDQYKHVSFKDLDGYLRKDDYLSGYCETEKELVRQNLGIETFRVDSKLSDLSTNPVQNKAITNALKEKADIDKLPKVAITGDYCDLHHKPTHLPNPEYLVIVDANGCVGYNGEEALKIKLPTHVSELTNDLGFLTSQSLLDEGFVKGISINNGNVIFPENGIVNLNISEILNIDDQLSLTSPRPVQNKVITLALRNLMCDLAQKIDGVENKIPKVLNDLEDVDAPQPKNGQLLGYVKEDGCEGLWKPIGNPTKTGDILIFNDETKEWEIKNIKDLIKDCLWTVENNRLVPNKAAIEAQFEGVDYQGDVATTGAIYSGTNS